VKKSLLFLGEWRKGVFVGIVLAIFSTQFLSAQTRTLRIATYNIEADINGATSALPGLIAPPSNSTNVLAGGVLEGIGEETVGTDSAQPLDILALQETTSNPTTVWPIAAALNAFYNTPGMFTNSPYQATESGGNAGSGNGPNAIVYNTKTLRLLASTPVDPSGGTSRLGSSSGEYREVMRYEFAPAGVAPAAPNEFYIYVSHYKSGTTSSDLTARGKEAVIIRTNEAIDLSATARVLYVGDYNVTASGEASYQTILTNTAPNGVQQGGGIDPFNLSADSTIDWGTYTTDTSILAMETESATDLRYRDDFEIMTTNVYYGAPDGLKLIPGTYHVFGNNGTTPYNGNVNSGSNTSLDYDLPRGARVGAAQLYLDLVNASDHLPVVADYTIPMPAPTINSIVLAGTNLVFDVANSITGAVFTVLVSTNVSSPLSEWTTLATNASSGGSFTFIATNVVNQTATEQFYILQEK
jgi:hypothetical protein